MNIELIGVLLVAPEVGVVAHPCGGGMGVSARAAEEHGTRRSTLKQWASVLANDL
ncbi:MAG: hypothetical protein ACKVIQ_09070 [Acidimicrobiales bacterium]